eukprot:72832-Chlamydomonas_euryale.AAC.10
MEEAHLLQKWAQNLGSALRLRTVRALSSQLAAVAKSRERKSQRKPRAKKETSVLSPHFTVPPTPCHFRPSGSRPSGGGDSVTSIVTGSCLGRRADRTTEPGVAFFCCLDPSGAPASGGSPARSAEVRHHPACVRQWPSRRAASTQPRRRPCAPRRDAQRQRRTPPLRVRSALGGRGRRASGAPLRLLYNMIRRLLSPAKTKKKASGAALSGVSSPKVSDASGSPSAPSSPFKPLLPLLGNAAGAASPTTAASPARPLGEARAVWRWALGPL